jgi:hypothetical protein
MADPPGAIGAVHEEDVVQRDLAGLEEERDLRTVSGALRERFGSVL